MTFVASPSGVSGERLRARRTPMMRNLESQNVVKNTVTVRGEQLSVPKITHRLERPEVSRSKREKRWRRVVKSTFGFDASSKSLIVRTNGSIGEG